MKTVEAKSHFKKISDKSSTRYGEKRPDLHWSFPAIEVADFSTMDTVELGKVATLANNTMEQYGRKLILANNENWDFDPSDKITLDTVYDDLTSVTTRKRTVTKETLKACGEFYARWASLIDKNDKAASAGSQVIAAKLQPIAAKPDALAVMRDNLLALLDAAATESDNNIKLAEELESNFDCLEWLIAECDKLIEGDSEGLADSL